VKVSGRKTMSNIINASGIKPLGHRVLCRPEGETEDEKRLKAAGLAMPESVKAKHLLAEMTGTVVESGGSAWRSFDLAAGLEPSPWVAPGSKVLFAKYAGVILRGKDGQQYRMVNDEDIVAVLDPEVEIKSGDDA
jgi:chaperonin GroES